MVLPYTSGFVISLLKLEKCNDYKDYKPFLVNVQATRVLV